MSHSLSHYEYTGALLRALAAGPVPLDEANAIIDAPDGDRSKLWRYRKNLRAQGFEGEVIDGYLCLTGGPTFEALWSMEAVTDDEPEMEPEPENLTGEAEYLAYYEDEAMTWEKVGEQLGISTGAARARAKAYADRFDLIWEKNQKASHGKGLHRKKQAYYLRESGLTWAEVAKITGRKSRQHAFIDAADYARICDLPMPDVSCARRTGGEE